MADTNVADLTRDQVKWLDKVLDIFGDPSFKDEVPPIVEVLECARLWYLRRMNELRNA